MKFIKIHQRSKAVNCLIRLEILKWIVVCLFSKIKLKLQRQLEVKIGIQTLVIV